MAKNDFKDTKDFDDIGVYTIPPNENTRHFNMPALCSYCKEKGILTNDLNDEELRQFEVKEQ